jgi:hypothetical protein
LSILAPRRLAQLVRFRYSLVDLNLGTARERFPFELILREGLGAS